MAQHQSTQWGDHNRPEFQLRFEDNDLGILVLVRENVESKLIAEVFSTNPEHLNGGALSVALVGKLRIEFIRKSIPFTVEEQDGKFRCRGTWDFGKLEDAVQKLGDQLGLIVFLLVPREART